MATTHGNRHLTSTMSVNRSFDRTVTTQTYQGSQDQIESFLATLNIGEYTSKFGDKGMYTAVSMRRLPGGKVCEATVQTTKFIKKAVWGVDFHQLSKNILTFTFPGETQAQLDARVTKIRGWEVLRDRNQIPDYLAYKYITYNEQGEEMGVAALTGNDLEIAKKIQKGIQTYNRYYPTITLTRTSDEPFTDDLGSIGKQSTPSIKGGGWTTHGNSDQVKAALSMMKYWVKTADNIITNPDASFTRREQWTGMDDLDQDLYPRAS